MLCERGFVIGLAKMRSGQALREILRRWTDDSAREHLNNSAEGAALSSRGRKAVVDRKERKAERQRCGILMRYVVNGGPSGLEKLYEPRLSRPYGRGYSIPRLRCLITGQLQANNHPPNPRFFMSASTFGSRPRKLR